jgi:hypothetical protein
MTIIPAGEQQVSSCFAKVLYVFCALAGFSRIFTQQEMDPTSVVSVLGYPPLAFLVFRLGCLTLS